MNVTNYLVGMEMCDLFAHFQQQSAVDNLSQTSSPDSVFTPRNI